VTGQSLQEIARHDLGAGSESLYVADEVNHVQWISAAAVTEFGADEPDVPFTGPCDTCGDRHQWRRVYVVV